MTMKTATAMMAAAATTARTRISTGVLLWRFGDTADACTAAPLPDAAGPLARLAEGAGGGPGGRRPPSRGAPHQEQKRESSSVPLPQTPQVTEPGRSTGVSRP